MCHRVKPALHDKAYRQLSENGACVPCFLMEKRLGDITLISPLLSACRNFRESDVVIGGTHGVSVDETFDVHVTTVRKGLVHLVTQLGRV